LSEIAVVGVGLLPLRQGVPLQNWVTPEYSQPPAVS